MQQCYDFLQLFDDSFLYIKTEGWNLGSRSQHGHFLSPSYFTSLYGINSRAVVRVFIRILPRVIFCLQSWCTHYAEVGGRLWQLSQEGMAMLSSPFFVCGMQVAHTLGIEAARRTIMAEIKYTMESHGMSIDIRYSCCCWPISACCRRIPSKKLVHFLLLFHCMFDPYYTVVGSWHCFI